MEPSISSLAIKRLATWMLCSPRVANVVPNEVRLALPSTLPKSLARRLLLLQVETANLSTSLSSRSSERQERLEDGENEVRMNRSFVVTFRVLIAIAGLLPLNFGFERAGERDYS